MKLLAITVLGGFAVAAVLGAGCAGEHRPARDKYNDGLAALAKPDYATAEKLLVEARSEAGVDPELWYRAAANLGIAYAAHADQVQNGKDADLDQALGLAKQALSSFGDADRLKPGDDTKTNLKIMRARIQAISDELRKGEGKLEVRLDRLIGDQRSVLDEARGAWLAIKQAGGSDPLAQQGTLTHLADRERGIVAEAGVVGDLAADEIDAIGKKPDDKRSDKEKVRVIQLKNLDLYLLEGRNRISEARRKLQDLAAEDGVARAEAALVALKRAREQLLDPITVMQGVQADEIGVLQDTAQSDTKALQLGSATEPGPLPGWLEPKVISDRQGAIRDRLEEVHARLSAALEAPPPAAPAGSAATPPPPTPAPNQLTPAPGPTQLTPTLPPATAQITPVTPPAPNQLTPPAQPHTPSAPNQLTPPAQPATPPASSAAPPPDPKQQKLLERVKAALPSVAQASAAMDRARQALAQQQIKQAIEQESAAIEALTHAIEQFSDLKHTVELAYREHQATLELLTPEAAKQLDATTRGKRTRDLLSHNLSRMPRIQALIADEVAQLDEHAAGLAKAGEPAKDPKQAEAQKQQLEQQKQELEQQKQLFARAEELRGQAQTALAALDKAFTANKDPMPPAKDADGKLTELRKLFFNVIEHLQELIREQGETRDQTSATSGDDDFARKPKLPGLIDRQDGHGKTAKAITDALAQQADAAGKQPQGGARPQGPDPKALAGAADEVRQAQGDMSDAHATLVKARDATTQTESLAPGIKSQAKALEHLENALKLLQPPPQKNKDQKDQDQQQQDQKQKQDQQQQQGGAGQRARDEDARRQRERRDREQSSDPVEKDW